MPSGGLELLDDVQNVIRLGALIEHIDVFHPYALSLFLFQAPLVGVSLMERFIL